MVPGGLDPFERGLIVSCCGGWPGFWYRFITVRTAVLLCSFTVPVYYRTTATPYCCSRLIGGCDGWVVALLSFFQCV